MDGVGQIMAALYSVLNLRTLYFTVESSELVPLHIMAKLLSLVLGV